MRNLLLITLVFILFSSCKKEEVNYNFNVQLENQNFKVDSYEWPKIEINGITYKINNPSNNDYVIVEFVSGVSDDLIVEQLFSCTAAQVETEKAKKQIPTSYELDSYLEETFGKKLDQFGGVLNINTDLLSNHIKPGYITIQENNKQLNMSEFNLHDQDRGCAFWSFNGTLSTQILDTNIPRNNFTLEVISYFLVTEICYCMVVVI